MRPALLLAFGLGLLPLTALGEESPLRLGFPLDCALNESCFIQNYIDQDAGPGISDFTCGPLSYDGHDGTDFALKDEAAMAAGVTVRAVAPGKVRGLRDGMADMAFSAPGAPDVTGRECGNGVLIDHGGGWESQYCHMKKGSLLVAEGDVVPEGQALGQVGLSGQSEFPHLHLSLRHNGQAVDPFDPDGKADCQADAPALWAEPLTYRPGGLLTLGFAPEMPSFEALLQNATGPDRLPSDAPALVLWATLFGGQAGDVVDFTLTGPDGTVLLEESSQLDRTQARLFRAFGKRLPESGAWPPGQYLGDVALWRGGDRIGQMTTLVTIAP